MKTISAELKAHIQGDVTTVAICWKITRTDSTVIGFTNHDADLVVSGVTYQASTGFTPSQISNRADLSIDNMDMTCLLDSASITEADIAAGLYDYAQVHVFLVNYADLTQGTLKLASGRMGEIITHRTHFAAEVRSLTQALSQTIGEVYSATCLADLGDARCGVTLASYTVTGTLTTATDRANFADSGRGEAAGYFIGGKITFTSGLNNGLSREVKAFSSGAFEVFLPFPYATTVGDTYSVYKGCNKTKAACQGFSNIINFRGHGLMVPGSDELIKFGGQ